MALIDKKILNPIRYHQDNANTVIGQASTMKALFDQGAEDLRVKLNGVIDELLATTGAQQIGIDPARGLGNTLADALTNIKNYMNLGASSISAEVIGTGSGDNVQAQLLWLMNQIQTMVLGQIPEGTITLDKLAIELANKINSTDGIGDLTALTTTEKTNLVGAVNELVSQSAQMENNNKEARNAINNLKFELEEKGLVDFINNNTGIGYYDNFKDNDGIDLLNTTAGVDNVNKIVNFDTGETLKFKQQSFFGASKIEIKIKTNLVDYVQVADIISDDTLNLFAAPGSLVAGDKIFYNGEEYIVTSISVL